MRECTIASLARALTKDIDAAWAAVKEAASPRIHTFIATSDIHMQHKLRKSPEQVLEQAVEMVKYAKNTVLMSSFPQKMPPEATQSFSTGSSKR